MKQGGKRKNSGRKPVTDPKVALTIYVHQSKITKLGGKDKARQKALSAFI